MVSPSPLAPVPEASSAWVNDRKGWGVEPSPPGGSTPAGEAVMYETESRLSAVIGLPPAGVTEIGRGPGAKPWSMKAPTRSRVSLTPSRLAALPPTVTLLALPRDWPVTSMVMAPAPWRTTVLPASVLAEASVAAEVRVGGPASNEPASAGPESGVPASNGPASVEPASATSPASGCSTICAQTPFRHRCPRGQAGTQMKPPSGRATGNEHAPTRPTSSGARTLRFTTRWPPRRREGPRQSRRRSRREPTASPGPTRPSRSGSSRAWARPGTSNWRS